MKLRILLQKLEAFLESAYFPSLRRARAKIDFPSTSGGKQNESRAITEDREEKWELGGWGRHKYLFASGWENGCNSVRIRRISH